MNYSVSYLPLILTTHSTLLAMNLLAVGHWNHLFFRYSSRNLPSLRGLIGADLATLRWSSPNISMKQQWQSIMATNDLNNYSLSLIYFPDYYYYLVIIFANLLGSILVSYRHHNNIPEEMHGSHQDCAIL